MSLNRRFFKIGVGSVGRVISSEELIDNDEPPRKPEGHRRLIDVSSRIFGSLGTKVAPRMVHIKTSGIISQSHQQKPWAIEMILEAYSACFKTSEVNAALSPVKDGLGPEENLGSTDTLHP